MRYYISGANAYVGKVTRNLFCSKEHAILVDNHRAIPVYLIHKTGKIAEGLYRIGGNARQHFLEPMHVR